MRPPRRRPETPIDQGVQSLTAEGGPAGPEHHHVTAGLHQGGRHVAQGRQVVGLIGNLQQRQAAVLALLRQARHRRRKGTERPLKGRFVEPTLADGAG